MKAFQRSLLLCSLLVTSIALPMKRQRPEEESRVVKRHKGIEQSQQIEQSRAHRDVPDLYQGFGIYSLDFPADWEQDCLYWPLYNGRDQRHSELSVYQGDEPCEKVLDSQSLPESVPSPALRKDDAASSQKSVDSHPVVKLTWDGAARNESIVLPLAVVQHSTSLKMLIEDLGNQEQGILLSGHSQETVQHVAMCLKIIHGEENVFERLYSYVGELDLHEQNNLMQAVEYLDITAMRDMRQLYWARNDLGISEEAEITQGASVFEKEQEPVERQDKLSEVELNDESCLVIVVEEDASVKKNDLTVCRKKTDASKKPFVCTHSGCGKGFTTKGNLTKHMKDHSSEEFACNHPGCSKKFKQSDNLRRHVKTHTKQEFVCLQDGCGKVFASTSSRNRHMKNHINENPFRCPHDGCNKTFIRKYGLDRHTIAHAHTDEGPYYCTHDGCDSEFTLKSSLIKHMKNVHGYNGNDQEYSELSVYRDELCEEMLDSQLPLKTEPSRTEGKSDEEDRKKTDTSKKFFVCSYDGCGKGFTRNDNLIRHVREDHSIEKFACDYPGCDREFKSLYMLKTHKKNHTCGRLTCPQDGCGKIFGSTSSLNRHITNHTSEKPFCCPHDGCNGRFTRKDGLDKHMRLHTKGKPFHCSYEGCSQSFKTSDYLKRHMKNVHKK